MLGVPGQDEACAVIFVTCAGWLMATETPAHTRPEAARVWLPWLLAAAVMGGTAWSAVAHLRPPLRAMHAQWAYRYGFYDDERRDDGSVFRWTSRHGVVVMPAAGPFFCASLAAHHPDLADRPVRIEVAVAGRAVASTLHTSPEPVRLCVAVPQTASMFMLELSIDRTWQPSERPGGDRRDLGAMVDWAFRQTLPDGASSIGSGVWRVGEGIVRAPGVR
jgi:hypothetical protein